MAQKENTLQKLLKLRGSVLDLEGIVAQSSAVKDENDSDHSCEHFEELDLDLSLKQKMAVEQLIEIHEIFAKTLLTGDQAFAPFVNAPKPSLWPTWEQLFGLIAAESQTRNEFETWPTEYRDWAQRSGQTN